MVRTLVYPSPHCGSVICGFIISPRCDGYDCRGVSEHAAEVTETFVEYLLCVRHSVGARDVRELKHGPGLEGPTGEDQRSNRCLWVEDLDRQLCWV